MTGEKPDITNANLIKVAEKTLIFSVNNLGVVTETTEDITVLYKRKLNIYQKTS